MVTIQFEASQPIVQPSSRSPAFSPAGREPALSEAEGDLPLHKPAPLKLRHQLRVSVLLQDLLSPNP